MYIPSLYSSNEYLNIDDDKTVAYYHHVIHHVLIIHDPRHGIHERRYQPVNKNKTKKAINNQS